eukprot:263531-Prorocentrum_minimum.AAC.1
MAANWCSGPLVTWSSTSSKNSVTLAGRASSRASCCSPAAAAATAAIAPHAAAADPDWGEEVGEIEGGFRATGGIRGRVGGIGAAGG